MASELEAALRAATAAATATKAAVTPASAEDAQTSGANKRRRNANKRHRARSRSESMVSNDAEDPVQRLEAFKARMFEVGNEAFSGTFQSESKTADDVVKVQWKGKTRAAGAMKGDTNDEDAIPQLTKPKVVVKAAVVVPKFAKMKSRKKAKGPTVVEIQVPQHPVHDARTTRSKKVPREAQPKKPVSKAPVKAVRDSRDSEDDAGGLCEEVVKVGQSKKAVSAAASAQSVKSTVPAVAPKATTKPDDISSESEDDITSTQVTATAKTTLSKTTVAVAKRGITNKALQKNSTQESIAVAPAVSKTNIQTAALKAVAKQPSKPVSTAAGKKSAKSQTSTAVSAPSVTPKQVVEAPAKGENAGEDLWDINSLVKNTMEKASRRQRLPSVDDRAVDSGDEHSDADGEYSGKEFRNYRQELFSQLIDEAARDEWELVEVGRLVRIFAAQWSHKKKKTARFLRRYCPELVSVDFLEGLNITLESKQLLKIFERGSGTPPVLMNKVASAIENGNLAARDEHVLDFIAERTRLMATNQEVLEFLMPLLESLSNVRDVGAFLKTICEHWHIDRTIALVQDILLTPVFDDLDGQQDEILLDLPALEGRLDFPSRMDDEDADENGNLKGLVAGEDSDLGESDAHSEDAAEEELGEILSDDAEDSHAEDEVYEGETDSEEEAMVRERLNPTKKRRPSRFILDEAEEDDDEEEDDDFIADDEDGGEDDESDDSSDDSDDDSSMPQRKRLRRG